MSENPGSDERLWSKIRGFVKATLHKFGGFLSKHKRGGKVILQMAGGAAFIAGLLLAVYGLILSQQDNPRPSITAKLSDANNPVLEAIVKVSGLKSDEHLRVIVEGITWTHDQAAESAFVLTPQAPPFYEAWLGPDGSGSIDHTLNAPLHTGVLSEHTDEIGIRAWVVPPLPAKCSKSVQNAANDVDCFGYRAPPCIDRPAHRPTGCVILSVPRLPAAPQVNLSWSDSTKRELTVKLAMTGIRVDEGVVNARVFGVAKNARTRLLAATVIPADANGAVADSFTLTVPKTFSAVCVVAAAGRQGSVLPSKCPPKSRTAAGWAELPTPQT